MGGCGQRRCQHVRHVSSRGSHCLRARTAHVRMVLCPPPAHPPCHNQPMRVHPSCHRRACVRWRNVLCKLFIETSSATVLLPLQSCAVDVRVCTSG